MSERPGRFERWLKFNGVGAIGFVVQLGVLALARSALGLNYLWATGLAVEAAVLNNFLWHEKVTWRDRESGERITRLIKFHVSNGAISIVGNLLLMKLLVGTMRLNYLVANVLSITAGSLANFYLGDVFVFARALSPPESR